MPEELSTFTWMVKNGSTSPAQSTVEDDGEMIRRDHVTMLAAELRSNPYLRNEAIDDFALRPMSLRVSFLNTNAGIFPHLVASCEVAPPLNDRWFHPQENRVWVLFKIDRISCSTTIHLMDRGHRRHHLRVLSRPNDP